MLWSTPEPRLPLGSSTPPYRDVHHVPGTARLPRGTVLVLDVARAEDWLALPEAVVRVRAGFPAAPVVLRVPEITADTMRLAHRASRLRVRAIVGAGEPLGPVLRPILTRPDDLGDDVVEWMALRRSPLPPVIGDLVRRIVNEAPRFALLTGLFGTLAESERTARHRFGRAGLPAPFAWHQTARALHAALCIQAQPDVRLLPLAMELGYSDPSGLTRRLTRTFGVTPAGIRGTLGWEWLLDRWLSNAEHAGRRAP